MTGGRKKPVRSKKDLNAKAIKALAEKGCTKEEIARACDTRWQTVDAILNGTKDVGGRPGVDLDVELIDRLAEIGCTRKEIAAVCKVSEDAIERHYMDRVGSARELGKASLRREQWRLAQAGNPTMLIWLGKQWLDQRDKSELTGADGGPVQYVVRMPEPVASVEEWLQKSK